jgi:hypothetical protein
MNEFQLLPNPTNVPEAVSTGYQRQNTNMFAIQTGLDTTEPYDDGAGIIEIPAGGIVELNGVMFKLTADIALTKPDANTAYWAAVSDNGDGTANITLVTRPGAWNPAKKGCYTDAGARTLNWVSLGNLDNPTESDIANLPTVKGKYTVNLKKGWYYTGLSSGLGGGNGNSGNNASVYTGGSGGGGGVATVAVIKTLV